MVFQAPQIGKAVEENEFPTTQLTINGPHQQVNIGMGDPYDPQRCPEVSANGGQECSRIQKSLFMLSISVMLLFTATRSMPLFESSIRNYYSYDLDYGLYLSVLGQLFALLFLPTILIRQLTVKKVLVASMIGHVLYMAAQFYPHLILMCVLGLVRGISVVTLMTSVYTYIAQVAQAFTKFRPHVQLDLILVRFFGIFFFVYNSAMVWSNFLRSALDTRDTYHYYDDGYYDNNGSWWWGDDYYDYGYGRNGSVTYAMAGILLGAAIIAVFLTIFLVDRLKRYGEKAGENGRSGGWSFFGTFNMMTNPWQLLLIPTVLWMGVQRGLFSQSLWYYSMYENRSTSYSSLLFWQAMATMAGSFGSSIIARGYFHVRRHFSMGLAVFLNLVVLVTLMCSPTYLDRTLLYFMAILWGISAGIWQSEFCAYFALLFKKDLAAAFTIYQVWEFVGILIVGVISFYAGGLGILTGFLLFGILGYVIVEWKHKAGEP